jgi:DNA-binding response OmpR family regulator
VSDATYVKCLATGFDHYVRKPFEVDDMQALIASLLD